MSAALHSWYSLPDLRFLAERGAVLQGQLPLARLGRLRGLLHSSEGYAEARISFRLHNGDILVMALECGATLELVCQRCLEPMRHVVRERLDFAVADDETSLVGLPGAMDLIALEGDRLQPATLIEDELIVALPLVPKHGDDENWEMDHGRSKEP